MGLEERVISRGQCSLNRYTDGVFSLGVMDNFVTYVVLAVPVQG